jgi:hypothetical protein
MRRVLVAIVLVAAAHAWAAAPASAGTGRSVATFELERHGQRYLAAGSVPRFTLAGVHWRGSGDVWLRTRSVGGEWSAWRPGAPEDEDGPDPLSGEWDPNGWRIGNPWWVGTSDAIQVRSVGRVTRVRAALVWSPEVLTPYRRIAATETPAIVTRAAWGASESIRRGPPTYASDVRVAIVHHTAGRTDYSRAEAPAVVRGIQLYHVQANGWNDIGYNFLVDRFGTVYEGRYGGVDRNVVGAHALGFNTGSVGIALLGTYGSTKPSSAAQDAIARVIAWRLDVAHVDPAGAASLVSAGSDRFASGKTVELDAVSGHRDTGSTQCPGDALYARLDAIAASARTMGGQKVFEPSAEVTGLAVHFRARLAQPGAWTVVVSDADGLEVARGTGSSTTVDWTWDASSAPPASYSWSIGADAARPATGSVRTGGAAPLSVSEATIDPAGITPNGDGQADSATVSYRLSRTANVTVVVTDAFGAPVVTVLDRAWTRAGVRSAQIVGDALPDGTYSVSVSAQTPAGEFAEAAAPLVVSRTLGLVAVAAPAFSPNGDGRNDELVVTFSLAVPATARVRIEREGRWVATPLVASLPAGEQRFVWDGARPSGRLRDGAYAAIVETLDAVGTVSFAVPFVVDTTPPRVRFVSGRGIRLEVDEPCSLTLRIDGQVVQREVARAGVVRIPWSGTAVRVRVTARDAAGNASPPVVRVRPRGGEPGQ